MATSPLGKVNAHDWRRTGEVAAQAFISFFAADLVKDAIQFLSHTDGGKLQPLIVVAVLALTEIGKRLAQSPSETPPQP